MGAFVIEGADENFNLKPKDNPDSIPDDQRKISHDVYETMNVLKLLKEKRAFKRDLPSFNEFVQRVLQAAEVGCAIDNVKPTLAAEALEQICKDIVRRKGRTINYRYLSVLLGWASLGMLMGIFVMAASLLCPELKGYGWVIIGSMAGAWISIAARRRQISFDDMQDFLDLGFEPFIRMLFVGVLASFFALFLQLQVLTVKLGNIDLSLFPGSVRMALFLGVIAGISEKALSLQILRRASQVVAS